MASRCTAFLTARDRTHGTHVGNTDPCFDPEQELASATADFGWALTKMKCPRNYLSGLTKDRANARSPPPPTPSLPGRRRPPVADHRCLASPPTPPSPACLGLLLFPCRGRRSCAAPSTPSPRRRPGRRPFVVLLLEPAALTPRPLVRPPATSLLLPRRAWTGAPLAAPLLARARCSDSPTLLSPLVGPRAREPPLRLCPAMACAAASLPQLRRPLLAARAALPARYQCPSCQRLRPASPVRPRHHLHRCSSYVPPRASFAPPAPRRSATAGARRRGRAPTLAGVPFPGRLGRAPARP
nr:wiskott-Aldrich syndrome protein homolog 1-like [Aegilops tauschii subsp. strangulata]